MRKPNRQSSSDQSKLTTQIRTSQPALELQSGAASSVGVMSPFQWSQRRKQFRRKADKKILTYLRGPFRVGVETRYYKTCVPHVTNKYV